MALDLDRLTLGPAMRIYAVRVLYGRPGEPPFLLRAVFDRQHVEVFAGEDAAPVSTHRVQLGVRLADFPPRFEPAQGDQVAVAMIRGRAVDYATPLPPGAAVETFSVQDVQKDGAGGAVLPLSGRVKDPLA